MTYEQFALNCLAIRKLSFVQELHTSEQMPTVYVELSPKIVQHAPLELAYINLPKTSMIVEEMIRAFEKHITALERAECYEAAAQARELLRQARK